MPDPVLSFESSVEGSESRGLVQVSLDGADWITIATLSASGDWTTVDLNLSVFAGQIVHLRFVFDAAPGPPESVPDRWHVRHIRFDRRH